ncbi:MAG: pca operon transcription factor PcaQ [Janthinobacterium lividum]
MERHQGSPGSRIKFRHLHCFLAVFQGGSVQRAADLSSITQPAVTKTLNELETILGVRLFERGRRGATPTREGRRFAPHARACIAALRLGVDEVLETGGAAPPPLLIGALPTVVGALLPPAMAMFHRQWRAVALSVVTYSNPLLLEALRAGEVEVGVGRLGEPDRMAGMSFEHLFREPLAVVVRRGHALASDENVNAARFGAFPIVVPPFGTLIRQSADSVMTAFGIYSADALVESLSVSLGRALVSHNDAVWFVSRSAVSDELASGSFVALRLPFDGTDEPIGLIRRNDHQPTLAVECFLDALRDAGRERERLRERERTG